MKLFNPFGFTTNVPLVKVLSGLKIGYLPSSISITSSLSRDYNESRRRSLADPTSIQSLQQSHNFTQTNNFTLKYNLTRGIPIIFRSTSNFNLANAGIKSRNEVGIDSLSYDLIPSIDVIKGIVSDTLSARRTTYKESYTASWRPNFRNIKAINWLTYSVSYGGGFQWNNSPRGSNLGASVSNTFSLNNTLKLKVEDIFKKFGFLNNIKKADQKESTERKAIKDIRRKEIENNIADSLRTPKSVPNLVHDLRYVARKLFISTFSMQEFSLNYERSKSGSQPGYQGESQFIYAFNNPRDGNYSPPFSYRTGLSNRIPKSQLIDNLNGDSNIQLPSNNNFNDTFSARTSIKLFPSFSIDLNWSAVITNRSTETVTVTPEGDFSSVQSESGDYSVSVWAFGTGYKDMLKRQIQTAIADISDGSTTISDSTGNGDGRFVLNRMTMEEDFRKAYLGKNVSGRGDKGLFVIPRPSWRISWQKVEDYIPFVGKYMNTATLSHSYSGTYKVGWALNTLTGEQPSQNLGNFSIIDDRGKYEPSSIRAERRFNPLLSLNITWASRLTTEIEYDRSTISTFAISSKRGSEILSQGMNFGLNYTFRKVRLKMFPKIKNNIILSVRGSFKNDTELSYKLDSDLVTAFGAVGGPITNVNEIELSGRETSQKRINGTLSLGYKVSATISSNFEYTYSRIESNNLPTRSNPDIRFNIRIGISSR